jgi:hypothetical protein
MARLGSDDVAAALCTKLDATVKSKHDIYYVIRDEDGTQISYTRISHGPRHTLSDRRVSEMARQLRLDGAQSLVDLVQCALERDGALGMMRANPSGWSRYMR